MHVSDELAYKCFCIIYVPLIVFFTLFFVFDRSLSYSYGGVFGGISCEDIAEEYEGTCKILVSDKYYYIPSSAQSITLDSEEVVVNVGRFSNLVYQVEGADVDYSHANIFLMLLGVFSVIVLLVMSILDNLNWIKIIISVFLFRLVFDHIFIGGLSFPLQ